MQRLLVGVMCLAALYPALGAAVVKAKDPSTNVKPSKPVDDAVTSNRKKDARREQLAKEIARQQTIMDRYEKQNSFEKKKAPIWISPEQYRAAKTARDKAQRERDDLAR